MWLKPAASLLGNENVLKHGPSGSEHLEIGFAGSVQNRLQVNLIGGSGAIDRFYCEFDDDAGESPGWRFLSLVVDVGNARTVIYVSSMTSYSLDPCTNESLAAYNGGGGGEMSVNKWNQFEDGMFIDDFHVFKRALTTSEITMLRGGVLVDHSALVSKFLFHHQQEWVWNQYAVVKTQVDVSWSFFVDTSGLSSMFRIAQSSLVVTGSTWRLEVGHYDKFAALPSITSYRLTPCNNSTCPGIVCASQVLV